MLKLENERDENIHLSGFCSGLREARAFLQYKQSMADSRLEVLLIEALISDLEIQYENEIDFSEEIQLKDK